MTSLYKCHHCGHMLDSTEHELGCPFGSYSRKIQKHSGTDRAKHQAVFDRAIAIRDQRSELYGDLWRTYGWRGALVQLRSATERAWSLWWSPKDEEEKPDVSVLLDIINYAAFTIQSIEEGNKSGTWKY